MSQNLSQYIGKVIKGSELLSLLPDAKFYKITNESEKHFGFQYKDGWNKDHLPFNPSDSCSKGGLYFFSSDTIHTFMKYCPKGIKWIREVNLNEMTDVDIYIEKNKFEKGETMILRKFEDGGWNYEGMFDKEGDDSSGFGRAIT